MNKFPIECEGMKDPTSGQKFFADGHEKIIIIDIKQKGNITKCPACQLRWDEYKKRLANNKPKRYGKPPKRNSGLSLREKTENNIVELRKLEQDEIVWESLTEDQRKEIKDSINDLTQHLNNL